MLVVCPLQSISDEQIAEVLGALWLWLPCDVSDRELRSANFRLLFHSAEKVSVSGFHVDFDGKILTISSFSPLKQALMLQRI